MINTKKYHINLKYHKTINMPHRYHHRHSYSSDSTNSSSRSSYHHRHNHHKSEIGVTGLVQTFDAPNFANWVLIPTLILTLVFYAIGFPVAYNSTHGRNRATVTVYDDSCKDKADKTNCPSHQEDVSPTAAYAIVALVSPIVAFTLCLFVYKIVIFIRNPKVAAGYFLAQGLIRK
jgi:hypothetical protein